MMQEAKYDNDTHHDHGNNIGKRNMQNNYLKATNITNTRQQLKRRRQKRAIKGSLKKAQRSESKRDSRKKMPLLASTKRSIASCSSSFSINPQQG